jgi:hypothetical protein
MHRDRDREFPLPLAARARFAVPLSTIESRDRPPCCRRLGRGVRRCARVDVDLDLPRSAAPTAGNWPSSSGQIFVTAPDLLLAPAEDRAGRAAAPRTDRVLGPVRPDRQAAGGATCLNDGTTAQRCTWWSAPRQPGRTPASGSASPSGMTPVPGPVAAGIRIPAPAGGSASTCTATSGMRAAPGTCGPAPEPTGPPAPRWS